MAFLAFSILRTHVDVIAANYFTRFAVCLTFSIGADLIGTTFGVDGTTSVMGIFLTARYFIVVAVKMTVQMVSGFTFFGETRFFITVSALPSGCLGAVIGVGAAMGHIIGFTFASKEMFCGLAFVFGRSCCFARTDFGIALGAIFVRTCTGHQGA